MASFDIDRFVSLSKAVDTSDLDWDEVARVGVTDGEHRCLRFMADVETHTVIYMRDLLVGHTAHDAEVAAFLACWVYEEFHHGRAIDQFLEAAGRPRPKNRYEQVSGGANIQEAVEAFFTNLAAVLTPHFMAAHMAWGAVNELCAAAAYSAIARRTRNRQLAVLLGRLAKDERKHFSFYYQQAERRLQASPVARWLGTLALKRFWSMVGVGVGGQSDTMDYLFAAYFNSERGREELATVDRTIRRLPGLSWWGRVSDERRMAIDRFSTAMPELWQELVESEREWEREQQGASQRAA